MSTKDGSPEMNQVVAFAVIQERDDSHLDQNQSNEDGEKWQDPGYIFKIGTLKTC